MFPSGTDIKMKITLNLPSLKCESRILQKPFLQQYGHQLHS